MKRIIPLLATIFLLSCDEHVRAGAKGTVHNIEKLEGSWCFYRLTIQDKLGLYSEDITVSTLADSCGKYQIGDTVILSASRCRLTNGATDTASHPLHGLPTAVQ